NVAGTEEVASLEYSVAVLGSQLLMVLGHTACGAVGAALDGGAVPGRISSLYSHIAPALREAGGDVEVAVEANVRHQAEVIRSSSPVMREATAAGRLEVVGAVYDLATGQVRLVEAN
ncbi:MAG: carbonic anhydrase, partial [Thioalkalivibrio sp.]|nr:carbonic anhydrase [Thioalkalivibrio sp.]